MYGRSLDLLLGVIGLLVVAAVVLWGFDLARAADSGPAWRRRLVGAGLALLALAGFSSPSPAQAGAKRSDKEQRQLLSSSGWRRISTVWKEAEQIASGKRGPYPFNEAGKKRVLEQLAGAVKQVDALVKAKSISEAGGGLLKKELLRLTQGVQAKRPTEMRMATCYEPMAFTPARDGLKRLEERLPLLEKLVAAKRIQPAVTRKVLGAIEKDLDLLGRKEMLARFSDGKERRRVKKLCQRMRAMVAKIKKLAR